MGVSELAESGPPPYGKGMAMDKRLMLRLPSELWDAIEAWRSAQPLRPSTQSVVRYFIELGMETAAAQQKLPAPEYQREPASAPQAQDLTLMPSKKVRPARICADGKPCIRKCANGTLCLGVKDRGDADRYLRSLAADVRKGKNP